jgi:hypothetical protein
MIDDDDDDDDLQSYQTADVFIGLQQHCVCLLKICVKMLSR